MDATHLKNLPEDVTTLKRLLIEHVAIVAEQHATIHELQLTNAGLSHRLDQLLRRIYGPTSERIDPAQLLLFGQRMAEAAQQAEGAGASDEDQSPSRQPRGKGHGRRPLPATLPRHRVEHPIDPEQLACPCCGGERRRIGEVISEQLDYVPASLFVLQHVRGKYACRKCEEGGVVTATRSAESQLIEKGLPGPGVVTQVIVSKFVDHLPLYRQEGIFARFGVKLARSTMCGWAAEAANLIEPLVKLMATRIRESKVINTDDTPMPVQAPGNGQTRTGRLWVYLGDRRNPYTVFDYTPTRGRDGPVNWLGDYEGYLQADAYAGYDELYRSGKVIEVGCWAHSRRKFHEARGSDTIRTHRVLGMIRQLYEIEKQAKKRELDAAARAVLRREQAASLLDQLHAYLKAERQAVLPQSPMGEAITYTLNQWDALVRYATDASEGGSGGGELAIDNNVAENAIRPLALGRKNYLFLGSDAGGRTAAILYSVIASARRAGIDVWLYLRDLLTRLPSAPISELPNFLPDRWHHPALDD